MANMLNSMQYTQPLYLKCLKWLAWIGGGVIVYGLTVDSAIWWAGAAMVVVYWVFDYMDYQENPVRQKEWRRKRKRIKDDEWDMPDESVHLSV